MSRANLDYEMLLKLMFTLLEEVKAEATKYNLPIEELVSLDLVSMLYNLFPSFILPTKKLKCLLDLSKHFPQYKACKLIWCLPN
jgi:hypothetical protein